MTMDDIRQSYFIKIAWDYTRVSHTLYTSLDLRHVLKLKLVSVSSGTEPSGKQEVLVSVTHIRVTKTK